LDPKKGRKKINQEVFLGKTCKPSNSKPGARQFHKAAERAQVGQETHQNVDGGQNFNDKN